MFSIKLGYVFSFEFFVPIHLSNKIWSVQKQFLKTFYFMHQFDPMNRERATAVLMDFWAH